MNRLLRTGLVACFLVGTACSSNGDAAEGTHSAGAEGLRDSRYCEIALVRPVGDAFEAEINATLGLNDCPAELWEGIDLDQVGAETGALAVRNGPRHWITDRVQAELAEDEIRTFDGLEFRLAATVAVDPAQIEREPYTTLSVTRDTSFTFDAGTDVFELTDPDGTTYVMQSYSIEVDPDLSYDELAELGERLALPPGWTFRTRVLDDALEVTDVDGIATVVQDDLLNTYQLRASD